MTQPYSVTVELWADRYEIQGDLGTGGNGTVHRVWDRRLGRELALKLLSVGEEALVVREAHALTALESPHILRVFNAGVFQDVPFIATDIAPMGSTEAQMVEGIGVPPEQAVRWVRQALIGLDYCHRRNVLHRDITPGNIFLDSIDHARLGDFGIATNIDGDGTAPPGGNQRCRAPEGFGGRLTVRSDLYSAGVALWRLLTGKWPFDAATESELVELMRARNRPRLRDLAPHVHNTIARVVEKALDPNPDIRPRNAAEMAHFLAETRTHPRNWILHHADQDSLEYRSRSGGSRWSVIVTREGRQRVVETRHIKSGNRVTKGCFETTASQLPVRLRKWFDKETP